MVRHQAGTLRLRGHGLALVLLGAAACGGRGSLPGPDAPPTSVPDLRGARVMVFPVQSLQGLGPGVDAELAFVLAQRGAEVDWVLPAELARAVADAPGMDARIEGLPVGDFLRVEVRRIGDPLYGYLRRVAAMVDSEVALVPVLARHRPSTAERAGAVEIAATLIAVRTGFVLWFGVVEGEAGERDDPRTLASAADALGRRLLPFSVTRGGMGSPARSSVQERESRPDVRDEIPADRAGPGPGARGL